MTIHTNTLSGESGEQPTGQTGEQLAEQVGELLRSKGLVMGTAESCTGGRIANMITLVAGSSDYFAGGVVSYSNEVKHNVLGVSEESLRLHGAVSRQVVEQMALGAIRVLGCDCSVATSGIAGPGGGTPEKPVGTVWIAAALHDQVVSHCYHFGTVRAQNIQSAADTALNLLLDSLIRLLFWQSADILSRSDAIRRRRTIR